MRRSAKLAMSVATVVLVVCSTLVIADDRPTTEPVVVSGTAEKIALLDEVAAAAKASDERIRTWSGSGTYVATRRWEIEPEPFDRFVRREADYRFAVDHDADGLMVGWQEHSPAVLVGPADTDRRLLTRNVNRFHSVLTGTQWYDLRTADRFVTGEQPLFGYDSSADPRVLVIRGSAEAERLKYEPEGLVDPRQWVALVGRHFRSSNRFFWDEYAWLKEIDEKYQREGKDLRIFDSCDVVREQGPKRAIVKVRRYWGAGGKPDKNDPNTSRRELWFEEQFGFAMTRCEKWARTSIHEIAEIEYETLDGISVPVHFRRTVADEQGTRETLEVTLIEWTLNQPIDAGTFSRNSLFLQDGDRVHHTLDGAYAVIRDGEDVALTQKPRSSIGWTPQGQTSLWGHSFSSHEWNDLVHQFVELTNSWMKANPDELPDAERMIAYALNRSAWEQLARRYVSLHSFLGEPHHQSLSGLNCLGQAIRMEYAGSVGDDAAKMLIAEGFAVRDSKTFAMLLAFSTPTSLASEAVLRAMIQQCEDRPTQAQARLSLARFLRTLAERSRMAHGLPGRADRVAEEYGNFYLDRLGKVDADAAEREAEELLRDVIADYPDEAGYSSRSESMEADAQAELSRLRNTVGRKAPEIVGEDFDGNPLSLSDTDGNVRVLMFWGQWCGPCRKRYPMLRELMAKHAGDDFEMLGICSDKAKDNIRPAVERGDVTWRFWWDGGEDRWRIHNEWGLHGAPWFFVLDREGDVRFKGLDSDELPTAVATLLSERTIRR